MSSTVALLLAIRLRRASSRSVRIGLFRPVAFLIAAQVNSSPVCSVRKAVTAFFQRVSPVHSLHRRSGICLGRGRRLTPLVTIDPSSSRTCPILPQEIESNKEAGPKGPPRTWVIGTFHSEPRSSLEKVNRIHYILRDPCIRQNRN